MLRARGQLGDTQLLASAFRERTLTVAQTSYIFSTQRLISKLVESVTKGDERKNYLYSQYANPTNRISVSVAFAHTLHLLSDAVSGI